MFILMLSVPLLLCSLGLYGLVIAEMEAPTAAQQMMVGLTCLVPSLLLMGVVIWFERSRKKAREQRVSRRSAQKRYAKTQPFNNGSGLASDIAQYTRPVTPAAILDTLERLRSMGRKSA
ncbi:MAG: hypothetical protein AB7F75_07685 [Planctomycetota bacterium]